MKEILMPKLSDTMIEGTVVTWRKAVGAAVERGEVIAEVETDKATMELEAFASGVLIDIRVPAGETVPVGTVIGSIGAADERPEIRQPVAAAPPPEELPAEAPVPPTRPTQAVSDKSRAPAEILAAPIVRRRARELGIDLASVNGSGPEGRLLLEDLEAVASTVGATGPGRVSTASPGVAPTAPHPAEAAPAAGEPLSRMRLAIARTVSESWRTIPHFSVTTEVRMNAAELLKTQLQHDGLAVSLTALLVKAAAQALTEFPRLNASLQGESLVVHSDVGIGIVVRRDEGLLVPVLHDCARYTLTEIARQSVQLIERARHGQLTVTELNGGTFAISNLGMHDIHSFAALILPPMAAVLAVGSIRDAMIVEAGHPEIGRVMSLTLSADHRIVDGVYAAEFLHAFKGLLEHPERLL
jgi:pyruvate dehydrogenase E2 component (dihydrolipoamide acetyltransferase)